MEPGVANLVIPAFGRLGQKTKMSWSVWALEQNPMAKIKTKKFPDYVCSGCIKMSVLFSALSDAYLLFLPIPHHLFLVG